MTKKEIKNEETPQSISTELHKKLKTKNNLKMSLTFAYFNFGILLLELASSSGSSWRSAARLDSDNLVRMIGLHAPHTVAPVAEEIAHKQQRDDAEDHETAAPGSVHECH